MPSRDLPARPHLDHLKHEAKALLKAIEAGDPAALARARATIGERPPMRLADAQRVVAREYGFASWPRLRAHVQQLGETRDPVAAFLSAVQDQDASRATRIVEQHPEIASTDLHVAAALGCIRDAQRLIAHNPELVHQKAGTPAATPLLFLCFSPFHGESPDRDAGLLATAEALLDAGADPNTRDGRYGVPALYGVTGMHSVIPLARLLLERGADPTDGESVFHAAELYHLEALELLLTAGADLNHVGDWGNTALYFLLRWRDIAREPKVLQGFRWLLEHGADPNVLSTPARETALHVAARRGQAASIVQLLLDHGADVHARRSDGASAWLLARRGGFDELATLLERAGTAPEPLSARDLLLEACGRGDVHAAKQRTSAALMATLGAEDLMLLPESAASGKDATVAACLAAGFPVDAGDANGATALHHAAIHGHAALVKALLGAGARTDIRDHEHSATALGWACFGADFVQDADGDYGGCVRWLLEGGAQLDRARHRANHPGVRAVLDAWPAD